MKTTDTSEKRLEAIIEKNLVNHNGYLQNYIIKDRGLCIIKKLLLEFIKKSQPDTFSSITNRVEEKFIIRLSVQIKKQGIIDILRNNIKELNLKVILYFKNPTSNLNPAGQRNYRSKISYIKGKLYYSLNNNNSLDVLLFNNSLQVSAFELKNQLTGQNIMNASRQYKTDMEVFNRL